MAMINIVTNRVVTVRSNIRTSEAMKLILRGNKEMMAASISEKVLRNEATETQKQAYKSFCEVIKACTKLQDMIINKELTSLAFVSGDLEESDKYRRQSEELQRRFNKLYPTMLGIMPKIMIGEDIPRDEIEDLIKDILNDSEG